MKFFLPRSNARRGFTLIELPVACHPKLQRRKAALGFTLIELLVVIGILTVLLAIVLIAINPAKQFAQANNTQRRSDVNAILNGIHQFAADNKGTLPAGIPLAPAAAATICIPVGGATPCAVSAVDLCAAAGASLVPTYLADLPSDPKTGTKVPSGSVCTAATAYNTSYTVVRNAAGRITVAATAESEAGVTPTISVTR